MNWNFRTLLHPHEQEDDLSFVDPFWGNWWYCIACNEVFYSSYSDAFSGYCRQC